MDTGRLGDAKKAPFLLHPSTLVVWRVLVGSAVGDSTAADRQRVSVQVQRDVQRRVLDQRTHKRAKVFHSRVEVKALTLGSHYHIVIRVLRVREDSREPFVRRPVVVVFIGVLN